LTQVLKAARPALHLQWELVPLMLVGQHHEPKHDSTNWDTKKTGSGTYATNWVRDLMSTVAAHLIRTRKVSSGPPCSDTTTCNMQPPCGLMMQWYEQPLASGIITYWQPFQKMTQRLVMWYCKDQARQRQPCKMHDTYDNGI